MNMLLLQLYLKYDTLFPLLLLVSRVGGFTQDMVDGDRSQNTCGSSFARNQLA